MRSIEAKVNELRGESDRKTEIPLTNFRGIELREFPAEIARLTLVIANYQCDVLYRGQNEALKELLPLDEKNWITCGNALRLDWFSICPPTGETVKYVADDLLHSPTNKEVVNFEGGYSKIEMFICGNPPYLGYSLQSSKHKDDLKNVLYSLKLYDGSKLNYLDYISGWLLKAAEFGQNTNVISAFVATNSICQGISISTLWPLIFKYGQKLQFAYSSFKWSNLASNNAVVSVIIVGLTATLKHKPTLYSTDANGVTVSKIVDEINPYLSSGAEQTIDPSFSSIAGLPNMEIGNTPRDGGSLILNFTESNLLAYEDSKTVPFIYSYVGSQELIRGNVRKCLWIEDHLVDEAILSKEIRKRLLAVQNMRLKSKRKSTKFFANFPHRFADISNNFREKSGSTLNNSIVIPRVSSENRPYLPVGIADNKSIVTSNAFAIYNQPLWNMALIASRLHLVWVATTCGRLGTGFRYSNTLGWNTFPVPNLTSKNKEDLTRAAENILLAREEHFPATIADLYKPDQMPENLRIAHEHNDEIIERIFIGRRFKNDTERLEKLFELYSKMTGQVDNKQKGTNH